MVKRILFAAVGAALLAGLFFGRDAASYVHTSAGWVKEGVRSNVPIEFEIERARGMVHNLIPDIRKNMHVIAQEEVEVERLEKQIAQMEATLTKDRGELIRLKTDLASGRSHFDYGGRTYSVQQVKLDLSNRFERFKTHDATLGSLQDILQARRRSLEAARQKLEGMLAAKRQLEVKVENLQARHKMVEVAQTTSDYSFDDSQLGRVKELITDVDTRLEVAEKMVGAETRFQDEIPLDQPVPDDIVDQVTQYLEPQAAPAVAEVTTEATAEVTVETPVQAPAAEATTPEVPATEAAVQTAQK